MERLFKIKQPLTCELSFHQLLTLITYEFLQKKRNGQIDCKLGPDYKCETVFIEQKHWWNLKWVEGWYYVLWTCWMCWYLNELTTRKSLKQTDSDFTNSWKSTTWLKQKAALETKMADARDNARYHMLSQERKFRKESKSLLTTCWKIERFKNIMNLIRTISAVSCQFIPSAWCCFWAAWRWCQ